VQRFAARFDGMLIREKHVNITVLKRKNEKETAVYTNIILLQKKLALKIKRGYILNIVIQMFDAQIKR
jgi:hypothetical protein